MTEKKLSQLASYSSFRQIVLDTFADITRGKPFDKNHVVDLLNGGASSALQEHVKRETRTQFGIFFSGQDLALKAAKKISEKVRGGATFGDPACGAGDLLLACLSHVSIQRTLKETLSFWNSLVTGLDLHDELATTTQSRLALYAATRHEDPLLKGAQLKKQSFEGVCSGDYFVNTNLFADLDCVIMNPPFAEVDTPADCKWSSGKVQLAAVFTASVVENAKEGQMIVAILPDVLRSGSRYGKWRQHISTLAYIHDIDVYGRFDSKTDVDVFILHLQKIKGEEKKTQNDWMNFSRSSNEKKTLSDFFSISVGAVVPHRHVNEGLWRPYIDVSNSPANGSVETFKKIRFKGTLHRGPFVVLRRTSSPSDRYRATATLVLTSDEIAVENHLVVLQPLDKKISTCEQVVEILRTPDVNSWLNEAIRCRHLTKQVLSKLPIGDL